MDHLQTRLEALEQRTRTVERQLRWWRGLACALVGLGVLTWALPPGTAQGTLEQRVAALEAKLVKLTFEASNNTMVLSGANLVIVNGLGHTTCTTEQGEPIPNCPNSLGNLIVGYNELRGGEDNRTGSHNVVVGRQHNFSRVGGLVAGDFNTISSDFAVVSGGTHNTASGFASSVSGGHRNTASNELSVVSGGQINTASGGGSSVSGGSINTASGRWASVSGGQNNTASGDLAAVSGGFTNRASGPFYSSVSGGEGNTASGRGSSVSGGMNNTASGPLSSSVSGGEGNTAINRGSSVSGGLNRTAAGWFDWVAGPLFADQ